MYQKHYRYCPRFPATTQELPFTFGITLERIWINEIIWNNEHPMNFLVFKYKITLRYFCMNKHLCLIDKTVTLIENNYYFSSYETAIL